MPPVMFSSVALNQSGAIGLLKASQPDLRRELNIEPGPLVVTYRNPVALIAQVNLEQPQHHLRR
jgi:hypothetical protein